jgi:hypothetical protein
MDMYSKQERTEAKQELADALTGVRWEDEMIEDGVCPNCAGTGYQDAEYEIWCDEAEEYVEGNECDGWGMYGCDEGEMTGASWVEILEYDRKCADRKASLERYDREKAIDEIAAYVKYMSDPRLCGQQVKIDYPHLGRYERTEIITAGMRKAGLIG